MKQNKGHFFTFHVDDRGIGRLIIDLPDAKVNTLSTAVLEELDKHLDKISKDPALKVLVVSSGKAKNFIAGADVEEFTTITDYLAAKRLSKKGQQVFNKLSMLPIPSIAVINGTCLGGGLELALACSWRIAVDDVASLGFPEVKLGIIPGWGGTQRLPLLIGPLAALKMILSGKPVDARKAWKMKLVDAIVPRAFLDDKVGEFIDAILTKEGAEKVLERRCRGGLVSLLLERNPLGRRWVLYRARRATFAKTKGHYPAPLALLQLWKDVEGVSFEEALSLEAKTIASLFDNPVTKNLIHLFFVSQSLKKDSGAPIEAEAHAIGDCAVLGAGVMGGAIAWLLSVGDHKIRLKDVNWDAIAQGLARARKIYARLIALKKYNPQEVGLKMHQISGTLDYSGFGNVDLVVEAIVEDLEIKKNVFQELEEHIREDTIVCSNTSSLSIASMSKAFKHPERFLGMHFFNPVNRMPLVEVVPGKKTSPEVVASVIALLKDLKKTPIVIGDCSGFLVNRILLPYLCEAGWLLEQNVPYDKVDHLLEDFGMPMGPYRLLDEIGMDIAYKVAKTLESAYGSRMRVPDVFSAIFEQGLIGKKARGGFYSYARSKPRPSPKMRRLLSQQGYRKPRISNGDIVDRMVLAMVNEAARCLDEGIVASADYLDMAMIMGTGFPAFRGGLMRYAHDVGLAGIVDKLRLFTEKYGERFAPSEALMAMMKRR